jgi:hypothetical protein
MRRIETTGYAALARVAGKERAERLASAYRDRFLRSVESVTYRLDREGRESFERLVAMRNRYAGERCFIIGNGPSIALTDVGRLRRELTFALNRGYLLFDRIGGPTTFLVAINRHVIQQFGTEIAAAGLPTFVGWRSHSEMPPGGDVTFIRRAHRYSFSRNVATDGASEGPTVTFMALQLAYHMGFREVVLIGVDHSFSTPGPENQVVTSNGEDANHFDPNYFGPGIKWQLPDLAMSEVVYRLAKDVFEADGRRIVDATVGGRLEVFDKVALERISHGAP